MRRAEKGYGRVCEVGILGEIDDVVVDLREGVGGAAGGRVR